MSRPIALVIMVCFCWQLLGVFPTASVADDKKEIDRLLRYFALRNESLARKKWTYTKLVAASDAVVIGVFVRKREIKFTKSDAASLLGQDTGIVALESSFKVLASLRPDAKWKRQPKLVRVIHFSWRPLGILLGSQPRFIDFSMPIFRQKTVDVEIGGTVTRHSVGRPVKPDRDPQFIMFLSARPDGRYEPVSGQYFPGLAFRQIDLGGPARSFGSKPKQ